MNKSLKFGLFVVIGLLIANFIANSPIMVPAVLNFLNVSPANVSVKVQDQSHTVAPIAQAPDASESKEKSTPAPIATPSPATAPSPTSDCNEPGKSKDAQKAKVTHYKYAEADSSLLVQLEGEESGMKLLPAPAKAYGEMKAKAKLAGINLEVASGFRSVEKQLSNFEVKAANEPTRSFANLVKFNAIAGFSEHHTGYAVDIASKEYPSLNQGHAESAVGKWLLTNAKDFGFELSFGPKNINNVGYEPWHWRYVGDAASKAVFCYVNANDSKINPQ